MSQMGDDAAPGLTVRRHWIARLKPYLAQVLCLALGLLVLSNLGLWLRVHALERGPSVAVLGVRELTQGYLHRVATSEVTPEEAALRAKAFLAVAQDEIGRMEAAKGGLVLARECVLGGETRDLTAELERTVERKLAAATGGLSEHVGPIRPGSSAVGARP